MYKLFNIFIFLLLSSHTLLAKEPFLATLVNVVSNDILEFTYENKKISCFTYGVITIDQIYRKADKDSSCKKSIEKFYNKRKDLIHYTSSKMKVYQLYPIIFKKDNKCIINIVGEKTLSESLIEKGLAVTKNLFKDKEYAYYFEHAEKKSKVNKEGIWNENTIQNCASYMDEPK